MSQLKLFLLGPPRVEVDGAAVDIRRRKALALLIYLAVSGQPHSRDALATLFYPDHSQSRARSYFRRDLAILNSNFKDDRLNTDRETTELKSGFWTDVDHFRRLLAECQDHDHPPEVVCPECIPFLDEAAALYNDDFLAGFTLRDCPEFDDWQFFQTESLRQELATALERLVQGCLSQGQAKIAIPHARRWVGLDPLYEPAQRALIQLYDQAGQPAAALRQYEEYVALLEEELGLPPEEETQTLYEAVKARRILGSYLKIEAQKSTPPPEFGEREGPEIAVTLPEHKPARQQFLDEAPQSNQRKLRTALDDPIKQLNLPAQTTSFVGRETELSAISEVLANPGCRLVTLLGPGGIGKTRLALEAASQMANAFPNGLYFVPLAPLNSAEDILAALAESVNFRFYQAGDPKQQLLDYLRPKQLLLVMDNFEHLLDGADLLAEILKTAPQLKILATSRERLNLTGETLYTLSGLALPDLDRPNNTLDAEAAQLFIQQARLVRSNFEPQSDDLDKIARICQLTEGMPLALVLAAGWLEMLSLKEIAGEIEQSLDFLETRLRDVPERQRSVRAAFDSSWKQLSPKEQQAFMKLSLFQGGFTRQAAQAVAGAGLGTLRTLINKSFIIINREDRYDIHELLRQFGQEKLEISDRAGETRRTYSDYYLETLTAHEINLTGAGQATAIKEIRADLENVRAAWRYALDEKNEEAIGRALNSLFHFFHIQIRYQEGAAFFRLAREQLPPRPGAEPPLLWGRILARLGWLQAGYGRAFYEDAAVILNKSLALAQKHGDQREIAFCQLAFGIFSIIGNDIAGAIKFFEQGYANSEMLGDRYFMAQALFRIGSLQNRDQRQHNLDKSNQIMQQAVDLAREIGVPSVMARALENLGFGTILAGDYTAAERHLRESMIYAGEIEMPPAYAQSLLGLAYILQGDMVKARPPIEQGLTIARDIPYWIYSANALAILGLYEAISGNWQAAIAQCHESLEISRDPEQNILAHWGLSIALCHKQEYRAAWQTVETSLRDGQEQDRFVFIAWLLPVVAVILAHKGYQERAVELLALASTHPLSPTGWQEKWSLLTDLRAELGKELGPETYQAVWEQGKRLRLEGVVAEVLEGFNQ